MTKHTLPAWLIAKHAAAIAARTIAPTYAGMVVYRNSETPNDAHPGALVHGFIDEIDAHEPPDTGASIGAWGDDATDATDTGREISFLLSD